MLVNNAGVMALPDLQLTPEGWELQFATNHLGHFALALGLHDALAAAGDARIVSVSSGGHLRSPVVFDDINFSSRPYDPWLAYGQSKTANVLFAVEATRRWAGDGITANAVHPGRDRGTNLPRHMDPEAAGGRCARSGGVHVQDARAGRRDERAGRDLTAARGHRRPLLRGLQRGAGRRPGAPRAPAAPASPPTRSTPSNAERLWDITGCSPLLLVDDDGGRLLDEGCVQGEARAVLRFDEEAEAAMAQEAVGEVERPE